MTKERWKQLMSEPDDEKAILTSEELDQGWHWCWDFDGLLVGREMGEWDSCNCGYKENP